jgi:hypothetical protein
MPPESSPETVTFGKALIREFDRATTAKAGAYLEPPKQVPTFTKDDYVDFVQERLGDKDFLPESLLQDIVAYLELLISILEDQKSTAETSAEQQDLSEQDKAKKAFYKKCLTDYIENFKSFYPPNIEQVLFVVPFTNFGNQFSEQQLEKYEHFKKVYVMANGLTYGHTPTPAFYADLLPKDVRGMCSVVPKFKDAEAPIPTLAEVKTLKANVETAFRNLKKILLPHIKQPESE